jgi:pyrroloquinoline-quinone synthase
MDNHNLLERIDFEIERHSVLKHRFYQMWSEGKLTVDHLQCYSKEYFKLVKAVPKFVENILSLTTDPSIKTAVDQNLKEESEHIEPWIKFAAAMGVSRNELINYTTADKTNDAVFALTHITTLSLEEAVAAMYAYEMELPKISRLKIEGLTKFYGMSSGTDATGYFEIHEEADIRHALVWRNILQNIPAENEESSFNAVVVSLDAQNKLLDSVQEKYIETHTVN